MKTILTKLKSTRGESLIETMAAILIFTFASILFLSLVTSAANINISVNEADEAFQAQQAAVEATPGAAAPTAAAVLFVDKNGNNNADEGDTVLATANMALVTTGDEDSLYTYYLPVSTPTEGGGEGS